MKLFKYSIMAVVATMGIAFSACSDDDDYVPGPQSPGVYFATTNASTLRIPTDATSVTFNVGREGTLDEADYPVTVTTNLPDGLFTFPSAVHFAQGEATASYVATCALPEDSEDRKYTLSLAFAPEIPVCQYGNRSINVAVTLLRTMEKFEHYGTALVIDAWITAAWNFNDGAGNTVTYEDCGWEVNLEHSVENPGVYQLIDPWGSDDAVINYLGLNLNYGKGEPQNIRIDARDPEYVIIEPQYTGVIVNNNATENKNQPVYIGNAAGILSKDRVLELGFQSTLEDGSTIEVMPALFGWDDNPDTDNGGQFGYSWNGDPVGVFVFYEGQTLETQALKSYKRRLNNITAYKVADMKAQLGFRNL